MSFGDTAAFYAIGYGYSVVVGQLAIAGVMDAALDPDDEKVLEKQIRLPAAVGVVERALYTSALLAQAPAFILAWIAAKVVGVAPFRFTKDGDRQLFQRNQIGTGVSLAYGATGWLIIAWLTGEHGPGNHHTPQHTEWAVAVASTLLVATLVLEGYVRGLMGKRRRDLLLVRTVCISQSDQAGRGESRSQDPDPP